MTVATSDPAPLPGDFDPHAVRVLLFDLGEVLIPLDWQSAFDHWSRASGVDAQVLRTRYGIDETYRRFERGEIDAADYFQALDQRLGTTIGQADLEFGWNAIFPDLHWPVIDAIRHWRARLPVYAFSNTNRSHRRQFMQQFPDEMALFVHLFDSSEIGGRKPEAAAFAKVVATIGVPAANILFFDDLADNVAGARACGLQAVHVREVRDTLTALEHLDRAIATSTVAPLPFHCPSRSRFDP